MRLELRVKARSIHLLFLLSASCSNPEDLIASSSSSFSATAATVAPLSSEPSSSPSAAPVVRALPAHVERARADTLLRLDKLQNHGLVQAAFPGPIRQILEKPDEVTLFSVDWSGPGNLDAVLAGTAMGRADVVGSMSLPPDARPAVRAWLFDGMTRPFGGMRCDSPHHALLYRRGEDAVAVVICFECGTFAMKTSLGGATMRRKSVRWDPAFRNYLKHLLENASIRDLSSDLRP